MFPTLEPLEIQIAQRGDRRCRPGTVAQNIVQAHGGEITLSNRSGGGVEARVTLPLSA
jgi:signal transduction histidine kinase